MTDFQISDVVAAPMDTQEQAVHAAGMRNTQKRLVIVVALACFGVALASIALFARNWTEALIVFIPVVLVLYVIVSQLLARIIQPLDDITEDTARIAAGDLSRAVSRQESPFVGRIARNLNQMLRLLREAEAQTNQLTVYRESEQQLRRATEEVKLSYDHLLLVSELGQQIVASLDLSDISTKVYETLNTMMDASSLRLAQFDREAQALSVLLTMDDKFLSEPYSLPLTAANNLMVWSLKNGREIFLNDIPRDHTRYVRTIEWVHAPRTPILSLICVPMFAKGEAVGVIAVGSSRLNAYSNYHLDMVKSLATYVALALDNANAYQKLDGALTELKFAQRQLVQSEKMSSLGLLTAGIAHEINNPINFVSANINPLRRNLADVLEVLASYRNSVKQGQQPPTMNVSEEEDLDYTVKEITLLLDGIEEGAQRTAEIVQGLRNFSRTDEQVLKNADVHQGIDSTLTLLHNKYRDRVTITKDYGILPEIECYAGQLNQVFMNILSNAIQAIDGDGAVRIKTQQLPGNFVEVRIKDSGSGMSEEVRKQIFDPFFTTKDVGVGTGLGLSISYGIVEKHGGSIRVESEIGKGSEFIIQLPIAQQTNPAIAH